MRLKSEVQDVELEKSEKRAEQASSMAAVESSKSAVAKEVIEFISMQVCLYCFTIYYQL